MFSHLSHRVFFIGCDEVKNFTPLSALTPRKKYSYTLSLLLPFLAEGSFIFLLHRKKEESKKIPWSEANP